MNHEGHLRVQIFEEPSGEASLAEKVGDPMLMIEQIIYDLKRAESICSYTRRIARFEGPGHSSSS
jgi:hypothetical protein